MCNILISYSARIPTVSLICHLMEKVQSQYDCKIREVAVVDITGSDIEWADTVLAIRPFEVGAYRVVEAAKKAEKPVVVYLDDDLLNLPNIYPNKVRKFLSGVLYEQNCGYLKKSLEVCDVLWGSNPFLIEKYKQYVGYGRCEVSDVAYDISDMMEPQISGEEFRIVFTGSGDHAKYLNEFIIPAINRLHEKGYKIAFTCIGVDPGALDECIAKTEYIPWISNFEEFNGLVKSKKFNIGVAPILNDDFHRCKYINKFIEYTRYGIPGIYTNDYPYKLAVTDNDNGFMVENSIESWADKIEYAINNSDECIRIANNAQALCKDRFSGDQMSMSVKEKIPEFFAKSDKETTVDYRPSRIINLLRKNLTTWVEKYEYKMTQRHINEDVTTVLLVYSGYTTTTELLKKILKGIETKNKARIISKESTIVFSNDIKSADVIVFCRGADPYMAKIAEAAKKANRKTVLYLDDDLYGVYKGTIYGDALLRCLTNCDILWASNPHIFDQYKEHVSGMKFVEGKVFDPIDEVDEYSPVERISSILYAGSPAHTEMIQQLIVPALNLVHQKFSGFRAVFVGIKDNALQGCNFDTDYVPWSVNIDDYRSTVKEKKCHIGIAVIKNDEFGNCKYYNKYLEYSRMGVAGVYSDVVPYRLAVHDGVNGVIVDNTPEAWSDGILQLLEDEEKRQRIITNSQQDLMNNFRFEDVIDKLVIDMPELIAYRAPDVPVKYHTNRLLHQLNYIWRKHIASRF